jgi:hypothetical protein
LEQKCEAQHDQLLKSDKKTKTVASMAAEESARRNAVVEFVKFLDNEVFKIFPFLFTWCSLFLYPWYYWICVTLQPEGYHLYSSKLFNLMDLEVKLQNLMDLEVKSSLFFSLDEVYFYILDTIGFALHFNQMDLEVKLQNSTK